VASFSEDFKQRPILAVVFLVLLINFAAMWTIDATRSRWATLAPDAVHTYARHYKGGVTYYFQPSLGNYLDVGFWVMFGTVWVIVLAGWLTRPQRGTDEGAAA
jgi:hypothetical protein